MDGCMNDWVIYLLGQQISIIAHQKEILLATFSQQIQSTPCNSISLSISVSPSAILLPDLAQASTPLQYVSPVSTDLREEECLRGRRAICQS